MDRMCPKDMWEEIQQILVEEKVKEVYPYDKEWTNFLTNKLVKLGKSLGYGAVRGEHWPRVDIKYFNKRPNEWGRWACEVAIEIENDSTTYTEELNKLFAINAGLKVLITYDDIGIEDFKEWIEDEVVKIYKSRKYHQKDDKYLLVFGPTTQDELEDGGIEAFKAFAFDGETKTAKPLT